MNKCIGTLNFHFASNFGAVLVAFSLAKSIQKLGFTSEVINYTQNSYELNDKFEKFRSQFLNSSMQCDYPKNIAKYSEKYSRIIVGSDQIFRSHHNFRYMLKWAYGSKTFISYAASFGIDHFTGNFFERRQARKLLSRFDALSVRESSGVDIMKNTFGLDAIQTLDPTLLLNPEDYQEIIDSEPCSQPEKYVGVMFLDNQHWEEFESSVLYTKLRSQGYEIINITNNEQGEFHSVPQWLSYIKNSSLMVTDSFHGTVFSTIFKKQFITRATVSRGNARIESLCTTLSIPLSRFYDSFNKTDDTHFDTVIDFAPVWKRIEKERVVSLKFLKDALSIEPNHKEFIPFRRNKLSISILSIEDHEYKKTLLLFNFIPLITKDANEELFFFGCIPFKKDLLKRTKQIIKKICR